MPEAVSCVHSPQISYCWDGFVPKRTVLQMTALPSRSVCGFNGNEFLDSAMPRTRKASLIPFLRNHSGILEGGLLQIQRPCLTPRFTPLLILQFCFYHGFLTFVSRLLSLFSRFKQKYTFVHTRPFIHSRCAPQLFSPDWRS